MQMLNGKSVSIGTLLEFLKLKVSNEKWRTMGVIAPSGKIILFQKVCKVSFHLKNRFVKFAKSFFA